MDAFKFAFETVMIGALALPWLLLMVHLVTPNLFGMASRLSSVPKELRSPLVSAAALMFAYLMGSAILPLAGEFLDEDLIGRYFPTEAKIQERVYQEMKPSVYLASAASAGSMPTDERKARTVAQDFLLRESALMLKGRDACERLNRLHGRLEVLRGATFNAFVLSLVSAFALCATASASLKNPVARWATLLPSGSLVLLALKLFHSDERTGNINDLPIMEVVLVVLGAFGLYVAARGLRGSVRLHGCTLVLAIFFTILSYGGYAATEVSYVENVYASYQGLRSTLPAMPAASLVE